MPSREHPRPPLRPPKPSRARSPTPLSERLCRGEERREPCPCKRENHKFSDLWRPKIHVVPYFIWLSRRSAAATSVADFSSRSLPARGLKDTPKANDDVASAEVEVVDAAHPLSGKRFRLVSIDRSTCPQSCAPVEWRV